ncbi:hypothetical protein C2G38_2081729 [Gigaspora rosea]|uniref:Trypsin-like cysteine/serine peptidase domain-containing protein n=1 Tax=Gigaspora rosea TaxID=44941 RepID=A0A397VC70_9GLOM|nr:hypothetical protein C2G38_2081729 [Gigaspora rosea]
MKPYLKLLSFVQVKNSFDQLNFTFNQLERLAKKYNAVDCTLGIESNVNNIVIYLNYADDARNQAFIDNAKNLTPTPIIEYPKDNKKEVKFNSFNSSTLIPRQLSIRILDGDGITTLKSIGSAGFWVRSGDSEYLATAGHVARKKNLDFYYVPWESGITNNTLIGKMIMRKIYNIDIGYIMKTNNDTLAGPIIRNTDNEEFPELHIMGVTDPDTEGTVVCKSGFTTHVTCGRITGIRNTVTELFDGHRIFEINSHVITDMQCNDGDSGAPVYQYLEELLPTVLLVGMVFHAGHGSCSFQPLRAILLPGMEVITI